MKNFVKALGFTAVLAVIAVIIACSGSGAGGGGGGATIVSGNNDPAVVAGYYKIDSREIACYWENAKRFDLGSNAGRSSSERSSSYVQDTILLGNDFYAVGYSTHPIKFYDSSGVECWGYGNSRAAYWKNGKKTDIHPEFASNSFAISIASLGTDVYIAGNYNVWEVGSDLFSSEFVYSIACYWKNGEMIELPSISEQNTSLGIELPLKGGSIAYDMFVMGSDVYIVGSYDFFDGYSINAAGEYDYTFRTRACYWKNGELIDLGVEGYAVSGAVSGTDVYILCHYVGADWQSCYWKNGEKIDISLTGYINTDSKIVVAGTDIYISGLFYIGEVNYACYWKNGERIDFDEQFSYTYDMIVVGTDVYAVGYYAGAQIPCYWKNGVRVDLPDGTNAVATAIAIR